MPEPCSLWLKFDLGSDFGFRWGCWCVGATSPFTLMAPEKRQISNTDPSSRRGAYPQRRIWSNIKKQYEKRLRKKRNVLCLVPVRPQMSVWWTVCTKAKLDSVTPLIPPYFCHTYSWLLSVSFHYSSPRSLYCPIFLSEPVTLYPPTVCGQRRFTEFRSVQNSQLSLLYVQYPLCDQGCVWVCVCVYFGWRIKGGVTDVQGGSPVI